MPLRGVWKLNTSGIPVSRLRSQLPRRLRFLEGERLEVPYAATHAGTWSLGEADSSGAQQTSFEVEYDAGGGVGELTRTRLLFDGLYDGERIAGSVSSAPEAGKRELLGQFLCTRLFSFWGEPKPAATRLPPSET